MSRRRYPTDLSDTERAILEPLIPASKPGGRPPIHERRELVNAILYLLRSGEAWRLLPHDLPPWQTVSHSFRLWRLDGTWEHLNAVLLAVRVHPADVADRVGARELLAPLRERFPRLTHLWVDAGYRGVFIGWATDTLGWTVEVVAKPRRWVRCPADEEPEPRPTGFPVLPRRWVVERSFAWLGRYRRLSKDYEALPETSEAWIYAAMSRLMLRRLAQ